MRTYVNKLRAAASAGVFSDARSSHRRASPRRTGTEAREALAQSQRLILAPVENYTQNEKWVNEQMLRFLRWGRDSLSNEELEQLQELAHSCPASEGLGVFNARFLNTFFEPLTDYDDYQLCNGANKGGKGPYDELFSFLQESDVESKGYKNLNGLKIFPVPAHEMLNIEPDFELEQDAQFNLYDMTGNIVASTRFKKGTTIGHLATAKFAPGIYAYRLNCSVQSFYGTVIIQH